MKIVFATNNPNKLREIRSMVPEGIEVLSLKEIECFEELPEEQDTLQGNAWQKANHVFKNYGYSCFADDTGLEISALNGEPGVYSARYAGPACKAEDNMAKVLKKLGATNEREASFRTVIHLILDGKDHAFEGHVDGRITREHSGVEGFGYDPIFQPEGETRTFAEMSLAEKNAISHRGRAVRKLMEFLNTL